MFQGYEGRFNFQTINPEDKNTIAGEWEWIYTTDTMERIQRSKFSIYRAADGRKLVWMLPDFEHIIQKGDDSSRYAYEDFHIFRKISDRIIDWEDIPF